MTDVMHPEFNDIYLMLREVPEKPQASTQAELPSGESEELEQLKKELAQLQLKSQWEKDHDQERMKQLEIEMK